MVIWRNVGTAMQSALDDQAVVDLATVIAPGGLELRRRERRAEAHRRTAEACERLFDLHGGPR